MSENMKGALIACALTLPLLFGVGWVADMMTRGVVGMMLLSHDQPEAARRIVEMPILPRMVWQLLIIWGASSAIVLGLAYIGFGGPHIPPVPKPPQWRGPKP